MAVPSCARQGLSRRPELDMGSGPQIRNEHAKRARKPGAHAKDKTTLLMKTTTLLTILALSASLFCFSVAGAENPLQKPKTDHPDKAAKKEAKGAEEAAKKEAKEAEKAAKKKAQMADLDQKQKQIGQKQKEIEKAKASAADKAAKVQNDTKKSKQKQEAEIAKINQERDQHIAQKTKEIGKLQAEVGKVGAGNVAKP